MTKFSHSDQMGEFYMFSSKKDTQDKNLECLETLIYR